MEKLGSRHQNLDQKVYFALKAMIIERKLSPGMKIIQDKLAQDLGVSRTPLVNALKKLEHEKLIAAIPRRGFFVRLFSAQEMVQIFELREVLEGLAARRTALEATDAQLKKIRGYFQGFQQPEQLEDVKKYAHEDREFHAALLEIGGKGMLADILETYNIISLSYQVMMQEGLVRHPRETLQEHLDLIDAICQRDAARAEMAIRKHLKSSRERLEQIVKERSASQPNHSDVPYYA